MFRTKSRSTRQILNYYRHHAPLSAMDSPLYQRNILADFLKSLSVRVDLAKFQALDFGCGIGNNLELLSRYFDKVKASDISQKAIEEAKKRCQIPKIRQKVRFILLKDQKLPFKTAFFDFILAAEVLEHVPNFKKTIDELTRVLKKGGYILISTPNYWNIRGISKKIVELFIGEGYWDPGRAHPGGYERFMTPQKLFERLRGFHIIKTCGSDYGAAWSPPMVKMYPQKLAPFFEIKLGQFELLKKFGMNFYILAQKL